MIVICSLFLICIVLIQRGRGGGLAGAFGGLGGSSAFGTKAGDVFTKVTVVTALIWFILAMALVILSNRGPTSAFDDAPVTPGASREVAPTDAGPSTTSPAGTGAASGSAAKDATDELGLPAALTEDEPTGSSEAGKADAPTTTP